ncbi:MAG: hypothetical protein ABL962_18040, partial [Fimbriimonadaceae bacterium]
MKTKAQTATLAIIAGCVTLTYAATSAPAWVPHRACAEFPDWEVSPNNPSGESVSIFVNNKTLKQHFNVSITRTTSNHLWRPIRSAVPDPATTTLGQLETPIGKEDAFQKKNGQYLLIESFVPGWQ